MKKDAIAKSKFKMLKRRLGVPLYAAVGVLESLWITTQLDSPNGAIGRLSNDEIAAALEWPGDADELIQILVDCRWLDRDDEFRLVVHDWSLHIPNYLKGAFNAHGKKFADEEMRQRAKHTAKHTARQVAKQDQEQPAKQPAKHDALARPILSYSIPSYSLTDVSTASPDFPAELNTDAFQELWGEWRQHRVEIKKPLKPTQVAKQLKWLASIGIARAVAALEYTIAKGWQGLQEPDGAAPAPPPESRVPTDEDLANWNPIDGGLR